jgi:cyclopropane fatty-acyl-phospholipid synthase-like methyltransferase
MHLLITPLFSDETFSKIFSVEAAQYFPSMDDFAKEAYRILKKSGKLIITAHFATTKENHTKLAELLPSVKEEIDLIPPIDSVKKSFKKMDLMN